MDTSKLRVPEVVEKLEKARTLLADVGVNLAYKIPSIVVIGDQSTGKSSLLSKLTDLQLLVGDGTVTRAPLKIFIRPGTEHKATLQYRLRLSDHSNKHETVELSAGDLKDKPQCVADAIKAAQESMWTSLMTVREAAGPNSLWQQHLLGDLDDKHWLLKDDIELFVDLPGANGSFTVVDLPGLCRPIGKDKFTKQLEAWVTDKIKSENAIILTAMTAEIAVSAGETNLSVANGLAHSVDPDCRRTLSIITKTDRALDKIPEVLQAALAKSENHETHTGCVLVATNPPVGLTEDDCLRQFEAVAEFAQLKKAGGGFGVKHLFRQLVELQGAMVMKLDKTSLISEVQKRLNELDSSLASYEKLPQTEAEAEELVRDQLHRVELSFFNSCKNASCADAGGPIKDSMILAMDEAAKSYVKKQSSFIPGILGKKKVLDIVMKSIRVDTKVYHCDLPSEYTAVEIFLEFHKHVAEDAVQFVAQAHQVIEEAIIGLLKIHLNPDTAGVEVFKAPELASAAQTAVKQVLLTYQTPLSAAVQDLTHSYTYVVETLHSEVLYETYRRLLVLASGIVTNDAATRAASIKEDSKPDSAAAIDRIKMFAQKNGTAGAGPSGTSTLVGGMVGGLTQAALFPVLGPFAGPLGAGVGFLVEQAWDAFRDVLDKYKAEYKEKKKQGSKLPGYDASAYQDDLVPLPWPEDADPMTSFELMCKMMNCDPGYVVEALDFYYKAFGKELKEKGPEKTPLDSKFDAVQLQRQLIACLSRMLCTHHSMTESVTKLVRMRLMSTHISVSSAAVERPGLSLPAKLGKELLLQLKANHKGALLSLLVNKETLEARAKLTQQKSGVEEAMQQLQEAFK